MAYGHYTADGEFVDTTIVASPIQDQLQEVVLVGYLLPQSQPFTDGLALHPELSG